MSDQQTAARIAALISKRFRTFGEGQASEYNPVANAMRNEPLMFAAMVDVRAVVSFVMDRYDELRRQKSEEWTAMASEPATDEEIESYKRHEGCSGSCLGCLEKFRLIARIERAEKEHCRSCCYLESPCDEHKVKP